jgi:hypothetical protein
MRKLTGTALVIFCALFGISAVLVSYSRSNPDPVLALDFYRCGAKVCILDIEPGETSFHDAKTSIHTNPDYKFSPNSERSVYKQSTPFFRLDFFLKDSVVNEVDLIFPSKPYLAANSIISVFGPPCNVVPNYRLQSMVLRYPGMVVFFSYNNQQSNSKHFDLSSHVYQINLFDNGITDCSQVSFDKLNVRWRGFRRY